MRALLIEERHKDLPSIFVALGLDQYLVAQGNTVKEAKQMLGYAYKVHRCILPGKPGRAPQAYWKLAKAHPSSVFYITTKHINQWRLVRSNDVTPDAQATA